MSTYTRDELLRLWAQGALTPEQAIGYLLQHFLLLHQRQGQMERDMGSLAAGIPLVPPNEAASLSRAKRRPG